MNNKKNKTLTVTEILDQCPWFCGLPASIRLDFLENSAIVELEKNQRFLTIGESNCCLYCVLQGALGISTYLENGEEVLLAIWEPVSWGGEPTIFDRSPWGCSVYAMKKSHVLVINEAYLAAALRKNPEIWHFLGQLLAMKLRFALQTAGLLMSSPAPVRLANRLILLATNNGLWKGRSKRVIDVRQEDLASLTFLSRPTVNELLQAFERHGIIKLCYGKVEILAVGRLEDIARNDKGSECVSLDFGRCPALQASQGRSADSRVQGLDDTPHG